MGRFLDRSGGAPHDRARWRRHRALKMLLAGRSELLTPAPGARVPVGLPAWSGAPETVQWTATWRHARKARDRMRVLEQGLERQRTPDAWLGGVSSIWCLRIPMKQQSAGWPHRAIGVYAWAGSPPLSAVRPLGLTPDHCHCPSTGAVKRSEPGAAAQEPGAGKEIHATGHRLVHETRHQPLAELVLAVGRRNSKTIDRQAERR